MRIFPDHGVQVGVEVFEVLIPVQPDSKVEG